MFEINKIMVRPHLDMSKGVFGLPGKNKNKAHTKHTLVMCCEIYDRRFALPSSGYFCRHLQVTAQAGAGGGGVAAWYQVKFLGSHVRHARIGVSNSMAQ